MNFPKRMKDHIYEEVKKRIAPKYEKDKEKSIEINKKRDYLINLLTKSLKESAKAIAIIAGTDSDFKVNMSEIDKLSINRIDHFLQFKEEDYCTSCHYWDYRMRTEAERITKNICDNLELNTKENLDKLLNEIH